MRSQSHQGFNQPITSSSGLFFDYLGKFRISNVNLGVLIPIDISHFGPHVQNIEITLEATKQLCNETRIVEVEIECHNMLQPLIARYQDMSTEFSAISHLIDIRSKRSAWIGGLGTIVKQIFGNLDENDGLRYDEAIESIWQNEKHMAKLMKENILVATSAITSYNSTLSKIRENEVKLNGAVDKLSLIIKNITEITNGLQVLSSIHEILDTLETSIFTLSFQLEDITNAILFSRQNILHPAILTPRQLYRELADNHRHLPSDLDLPVALDINSVHLILSISSLICYYVNDKIIFVLQVPLVNIQEYMLFQNIALPTPYDVKQSSVFSLIVPNSKYIAMTKDKSHYCTLNQLQDCKIVNPGNYLCNIENVYVTETKPTCEIELLAKTISEKPLQCDVKTISGKIDIWKPLINNRWIYVQSEPNKISIDCANSESLYEITVLGTGILTIPITCIGYCKSTILLPRFKQLNITSPINHIPEFNLINDTCCNLVKVSNIDNMSSINLNNIDLDNLYAGNKDILDSLVKSLEVIEHQPNYPHIVKYGTYYSTLFIVSFLLFCLFVIYVILKRICKSGSNRPLQVKFRKPKLSPISTDITDRQDPEVEIISVAPLRTQI